VTHGEGLAPQIPLATLTPMNGKGVLALVAFGGAALGLSVVLHRPGALQEPEARPIRGHVDPIPESPSLERSPVITIPAKMPNAVASNVPVAVEALPDDLPARVVATIERLRRCQENNPVHWRVPERFTISAENAARLVSEFEQVARQFAEAEDNYRDAQIRFVDAEIDAGRGVPVKGDINQVIKELELAGKYNRNRDHLGYGIRFEAGTFYVLAKRGSTPDLDPQLDYCDSMTLVYRETCGRLLSYLNF